MAKQAVALRLEPELLAWVDSYAKSRKVSRQVVLETAVEGFKVDCSGGVPDLPALPAKAPVEDGPAQWLAARQARLNAAKYRGAKA